MARTRAYIKTTLLHSQKWRSLKNNDRAKLLYLFFHITPNANSIGCYRIPIGYPAIDLLWGEQQVAEAIESLSKAYLIDWNPDEEIILIVDFVKHDPPTNEKHAMAMVQTAISLPDCIQKLRVINDLMATEQGVKVKALAPEFDRLSKAYPKPLAPSPSPSPSPSPNPKPNPLPKSVCAEPPSAPATPAFILLPTTRFESAGEAVPITDADVEDYSNTYPAVDVPQEFRKIRRWLLDNKSKRKTSGGMRKFVNSWLAREQDKGGRHLGLNGGGSKADRRLETSVDAARSVMEERHGPAGKSH
jgi:hypothetical protein